MGVKFFICAVIFSWIQYAHGQDFNCPAEFVPDENFREGFQTGAGALCTQVLRVPCVNVAQLTVAGVAMTAYLAANNVERIAQIDLYRFQDLIRGHRMNAGTFPISLAVECLSITTKEACESAVIGHGQSCAWCDHCPVFREKLTPGSCTLATPAVSALACTTLNTAVYPVLLSQWIGKYGTTAIPPDAIAQGDCYKTSKENCGVAGTTGANCTLVNLHHLYGHVETGRQIKEIIESATPKQLQVCLHTELAELWEEDLQESFLPGATMPTLSAIYSENQSCPRSCTGGQFSTPAPSTCAPCEICNDRSGASTFAASLAASAALFASLSAQFF